MSNVLVRDLPDDVHADLVRRADAAGQSLQQYLLAELTKLARRPSLDDVLAGIGRHQGGRVPAQVAVTDLDEDRAGR